MKKAWMIKNRDVSNPTWIKVNVLDFNKDDQRYTVKYCLFGEKVATVETCDSSFLSFKTPEEKKRKPIPFFGARLSITIQLMMILIPLWLYAVRVLNFGEVIYGRAVLVLVYWGTVLFIGNLINQWFEHRTEMRKILKALNLKTEEEENEVY